MSTERCGTGDERSNRAVRATVNLAICTAGDVITVDKPVNSTSHSSGTSFALQNIVASVKIGRGFQVNRVELQIVDISRRAEVFFLSF